MTSRFTILMSLIVALFACVVRAQQKLEVLGAYPFARLDGGPNLNGWHATLTGNFKSNFGITTDFSRTYGGGIWRLRARYL